MKLNHLRTKARSNDQCQTIVQEDQSQLQDSRSDECDASKLKHINFFQDLEDGLEVSVGGNEKYLKDKKEEQEKYEKQIGYLTYLGQDTNESLGKCQQKHSPVESKSQKVSQSRYKSQLIFFTGKRDWYDVAPKKIDAYDDRGDKLEVGLKAKNYNDPLNVMKKYIKETEKLSTAKVNAMSNSKFKTLFPILMQPLPPAQPPNHVPKHHKKKSKKSSKSKKHKKEKSKKRSRSRSPKSKYRMSNEKNEKLLRLRAERLRREEIERNRTKLLLAKYTPTDVKQGSEPEIVNSRASLAPTIIEPVKVKQKYNSQFNPEIAKQNYEDTRRY